MVRDEIKPDSVRKIILDYAIDSFDKSTCPSIRLFDKNNKMINQCGLKDQSWAIGRHEIKLEENERLVGLVCSTNSGGEISDVQFIIGKKNF